MDVTRRKISTASLGGYCTIMSKNGMKSGCPACGGPIVKAAYLGGSVYYCPVCQPEKPEA